MSSDVLIPIDAQEPELSNQALQMAVAQALYHQGDLHILTVVPGFNMPMVASYFPDDAMEHALNAVDSKLRGFIKDHVPDAIHTHLHVKSGNPYKQIIRLAKKLETAMIVIPSLKHGRVDKVLLGSVASKVVERANCSVLVVREHPSRDSH
ncbi:MAG: universal stress protein [Halopseudomonas sp.]